MREGIGAEHRQRNSRHAHLRRQPPAKADVVQIGNRAVVRQQEVGPFTRQNFQTAFAQRIYKQIPTRAVKIRQLAIVLRFAAQHIRQRQLGGGIDRKGQVLMHLAQLRADGRRGHAVPYLPAGHMVGFSK